VQQLFFCVLAYVAIAIYQFLKLWLSSQELKTNTRKVFNSQNGVAILKVGIKWNSNDESNAYC
jgi:hypothetical protein